ncbi:MAG: GNAT family N-acetyltransferase [Candidatus Berkelbacteria bacterium]
MTEIKYTTLKHNYSEHLDELVNFYEPKYQKPFNRNTVLNSSIICLAIAGDEIVGAVRALTDFSRHGIIVDLMVDENFRRQKIGSNLLKNIALELTALKIPIVSLTTEPDAPWLVVFYEKHGFRPIAGSVNMSLGASDTQ